MATKLQTDGLTPRAGRMQRATDEMQTKDICIAHFTHHGWSDAWPDPCYVCSPFLAEVSGAGREERAASHKAVATGQAYKMLRKVLDVQCNDKYLEHCSMQKVRAKDGTIEFVSEATKARFIERGRACLIWNNQAALAPSSQALIA